MQEIGSQAPRGDTRDVVLITGASQGIGAELARVFAREGHDLALTARSGDRLEALADEIAASGRRRPVVVEADLGARGAADGLIGRLGAQGARVSTLVNNAGFGLIGPAAALDRAEQIAMIDLNVRALTDLTLACLPALRAARGRILNVASLAAFAPGPGMAVYYATKAFVLSFSEAMSEELKADGVIVTALCPGPTPTHFFKRAGAKGDPFGLIPKTTPAQVAEQGYRGLMAGRRVVAPGLMNRVAAMTSGLAPRAFVLPALARMQMKRGRGD